MLIHHPEMSQPGGWDMFPSLSINGGVTKQGSASYFFLSKYSHPTNVSLTNPYCKCKSRWSMMASVLCHHNSIHSSDKKSTMFPSFINKWGMGQNQREFFVILSPIIYMIHQRQLSVSSTASAKADEQRIIHSSDKKSTKCFPH